MKRNRILSLFLAVHGLSAVALSAADPADEHELTLDAEGHPRVDLNLTGAHVTGTLDAARLPAGVGSAFLPGVNRLTGTDATALDHASLAGINVGDVRQMVFTADLGNFFGGIGTATGTPLSYVVATYRLIDSTDETAPPYLVATPTAGKAWQVVQANTSGGDVILSRNVALVYTNALYMGEWPNGGYIAVGAGGNINTTENGGYLLTTGNGGSINTSGGGGVVYTFGQNGQRGGDIMTYGDSYVGPGGSINTSAGGGYISTAGGGGYIDTSAGGGYISTAGGGGYVDTSVGGNIDTSNGGGSISTTGSGGSVSTAVGGGSIATYSYGGDIMTNGHGSPEGVVYAPIGSLYCDQDGTPGHVLYVKEPGSDDGHGWVAK